LTIPLAQAPVIAPLPSTNRVEDQGRRTGAADARRIVEAHRQGLIARRQRDLLSEQYLLHLDGSGDFCWAAIYEGQRIAIPHLISEYQKTENLLRLVVDNAVAHHTTMPLKFFAESTRDRRSRDRALIDMLWMNYLADQQDLNGLFADALYLAMPAGFCPAHRYWRDDVMDQHEPIAMTLGDAGAQGVRPGMIDCWLGNPFDTVFDPGATRGNVHWCSYGRVLPAGMVRATFRDLVPEIQNMQGSTRISNASIFQRIAQRWRLDGLGVHGTVVADQLQNRESADELMYLLCRETLPGVDEDYPDGRLQIVVVPGEADLMRGEGGSGSALSLVDQALPARDFSWTLFYSSQRGNDIHGQPWVENLDQLQTDLNIAISKEYEFLNKAMEAPIVAPGGALSEDMTDLGGYNIMEIEPSLASWRPRAMEWPQYILEGWRKEADDKRRAIYTGGGYQASSRGESPGSRMAYRAIVALQQADNTVHGPVNLRFRRSACEFATGCWRQMKTYGLVPWIVAAAGDEAASLAEPYIDATKLSNRPPTFKLTNAFGPSPELRAQEVIELAQTRGADGQPFMTTEEARRAYPNPSIFSEETYPDAVKKRRARSVANAIVHLASQFREKTGFQQTDPANPWVQNAALQVAAMIEQRFPRLRDDDLMAHLAAYSEITQDESADVIARLAAQSRQGSYYDWQAMQSAQIAPQPGALGPGGAPPNSLNPRMIAAQMQGGGGQGAVLSDENAGPSPIAATARG